MANPGAVMTLESALAEIMPAAENMSRLVVAAPVEPRDAVLLAMNVAAHFLGTACAVLDKADGKSGDMPLSVVAESMAKTIIGLLREQERAASH